jgi:hypothetical protein
MNGKLGSLYLGKTQVGGLCDWSLDLSLIDYQKDIETYYKLSKWKLTAQSYWLYDVPNKVMVKLYPNHGKGYWEGKAILTSVTRKVFDTMIHEPIEFIGEGILEGKE